MNKNFAVLVSVTLNFAPLSAAAQMHGQMGAKSNASVPGMSAASLTNSGSVSMPLMPTANLNTALAAPTPTVNSALTPAVAAPAASEKPVYAKSLYGDGTADELVSPASQRYSGSAVDYALGRPPEKISFDGSETKSGNVDEPTSNGPTYARSLNYNEDQELVPPASKKYIGSWVDYALGRAPFKETASSARLLNEIGNKVDLNNGSALVKKYDTAKFDLKKSVAALEKRLSNSGPYYQYKTTIGADKVIALLKIDDGIQFWLKKDAPYLAARLDEMQKAGRLKAVFARTDSIAYETYTVRFYFEIYTNDGHVLHLHFAMSH